MVVVRHFKSMIKKHAVNQDLRRKILHVIWSKEEERIAIKTKVSKITKGSLLDQMREALESPFYEQAKAAIIQKWVGLCKHEHIDRIMQWRLRLMALKLPKSEISFVHMQLWMLKSARV